MTLLEKFTADPAWPYLRQNEAKLLTAQQMTSSKKFDPKRSVWVPDPNEGFIAAEIKSSSSLTSKNGGEILVVVNNKGDELRVPKEETQPRNPPKFELSEDMAELTHLNEASVLHNLRQRYAQSMIYTYSGLFCVAINPYRRLPIYTENVCKMYIGRRRNEMPPHIFSICDEAYRNLMNEKENQSMLITGESGAGKTENTKKVIAYFAVVGSGGPQKRVSSSGRDARKEASTLEEQVVRTNPVLEAFGNAKTIRNNNSSRFGKFIRIHFNKAGRLAGGDIEHYLLEKSRVIKQLATERSYHIFYQIMSDAIPGLKKKLFLNRPIRDYHFVSQGEISIEGLDDKEEMHITDESFDIMKFSAKEKFEMYSLVAAVMHMGEMRFKQRPREEQAEVEDIKEGEIACKLFGVDTETFVTSILKPRVKIGAEWVNKGQNLEQVNHAVGALAKALYARMFAWLIRRCNATLDVRERQREHFIGVLDIAGFEIFELNSFEQLWINFVNERLQQFFNHHMFILEQEEYQREGIQWAFIDFGLDLQPCIELIEKPLGIISMLDEECIVPKATDSTFVQKLNDQHMGKHANYQRPKPPKGKQVEAHFAVIHYAGTVQYNAQSWLEKNKDPLNDSVVAVLKNGPGMALLKAIWEDYQTQEDEKKVELSNGGNSRFRSAAKAKKGKSSSFQTVSMIYRQSLANLIKMLHQTHPHFIRCIIPNEQKKSGIIDASLVLNQLTCNGVLEGIRICRKGFPNRVAYADFRQRYAVLAAQEATDPGAIDLAGKRMCQRMEREGKLSAENYQCGKTKVFFRTGVLATLEELRDDALAKIIAQFQRICRYYLAQKELQRRKNESIGVRIIQRNVRKWCSLRGWHWFKLLGRVRPLIAETRHKEEEAAAELESVHKRCSRIEAEFAREEKQRRELEAEAERQRAERQQLEFSLSRERDRLAEAEAHSQLAAIQKKELERQLDEMSEQLGEQESSYAALAKGRKKLESDMEMLRKQLAEADATIRRQESERVTREAQTRSLQDEIAMLDENVAKIGKERKHHEELNRKLLAEAQGFEERIAQLNRSRQKLEQSLDQAEETLERERKARQELDKQRRKTEGELKIAQENLEELGRQREELENAMKRKETELQQLASRLEEERALVTRLQRQVKELVSRVQELEDELDTERAARVRAEKARAELQVENDELVERMDELGGVGAAHMELNKRREAEVAKMRREMEECALQSDVALQALKKKNADATASLNEQLDAVQKARIKAEKEKVQRDRDLEQLQNQLEGETKQRQNAERNAKQWENQALEAQAKSDEKIRICEELQAWKSRAQTEKTELTKQFEEAEEHLGYLSRAKTTLTSQLEEAQRFLDQENRERLALVSQLSNFQLQCQQLREELEEEKESKSELLRQLSKANAETQQWRAKFEGEGLLRAEELEEQRRKILAKSQEVHEELEQAQQRVATLEKGKHRMVQELEDAQLQAERANQMLVQTEKKHKGVDRLLDEWRVKCDALEAETEAAERNARMTGTELLRLRSALEEAEEQLEAVRRENKALAQELHDSVAQLSEGGRGEHEMSKAKRRLELEKEELQLALESAESALEAEENKLLRAQVEILQIRAEIDKRIAEKEEEFENTRKTHQRALDSMQATLEAESRARTELVKTKKKLENDIGEMEIGLEQANRANHEAQKHLRKHQEHIRELQQQVDEEQQQRDLLNEQAQAAERRAQQLAQEKEEALIVGEQAERVRRQLDVDNQELREALLLLEQQTVSLSAQKRKLEADLALTQSDLNEMGSELRGADERCKRAMSDAARLAEELRQEQDHAQHLERQRKALETHAKDLQQRVDEADLLAHKGGKKAIAKLEQRVINLASELEAESRRHTETQKALRAKERRVRELQFQVDEDKKGQERLYQLVERLQQKLKTFKRQNEESEQVASLNLNKYRQIQYQLEDAEERADLAENSLAKYRAKSRSSANIHGHRVLVAGDGGGAGGGGGLRSSASTASVLHHHSALHQQSQFYSSVQHTSSLQNNNYNYNNHLNGNAAAETSYYKINLRGNKTGSGSERGNLKSHENGDNKNGRYVDGEEEEEEKEEEEGDT